MENLTAVVTMRVDVPEPGQPPDPIPESAIRVEVAKGSELGLRKRIEQPDDAIDSKAKRQKTMAGSNQKSRESGSKRHRAAALIPAGPLASPPPTPPMTRVPSQQLQMDAPRGNVIPVRSRIMPSIYKPPNQVPFTSAAVFPVKFRLHEGKNCTIEVSNGKWAIKRQKSDSLDSFFRHDMEQRAYFRLGIYPYIARSWLLDDNLYQSVVCLEYYREGNLENYFKERHRLSHWLEFIPTDLCEEDKAPVERSRQRIKRIYEREELRWCYQLLSALTYMHRKNVTHNSIQPANILIDRQFSGHLPNIRVCDFSAATVDLPMSSYKKDIFAFAMTCYMILFMGHPPNALSSYNAFPPNHIIPDFVQELEFIKGRDGKKSEVGQIELEVATVLQNCAQGNYENAGMVLTEFLQIAIPNLRKEPRLSDEDYEQLIKELEVWVVERLWDLLHL